MTSLDRFNRAGPYEDHVHGRVYTTCDCGRKVYDERYQDEDYCLQCASDKIDKFRQELDKLLEDHDMTLKPRGPNILIEYHEDSNTEEWF